LIKSNPGGSRNGKVVLVQHRDIEDPDHGGTYTVKTYHSEKIEEEGGGSALCLNPKPMLMVIRRFFIEGGGEEMVVVGEFLSVI
jgi:hypothetical protein